MVSRASANLVLVVHIYIEESLESTSDDGKRSFVFSPVGGVLYYIEHLTQKHAAFVDFEDDSLTTRLDEDDEEVYT